MKASELRIGNLVYDDDWGIMVVESVLGGTLRAYLHTPDKEYLADFPLSEVQPLHLTKEWLVKFGFSLVAGKEGYHWDNAIFKIGGEGKWFIPFGIDSFESIDVVYVHQLQNLYFALTGEELTIK